jgi:hypothetical protein
MKHIDDLFSEKLSGHSLPPSDKAWEKIAASGVIGKKERTTGLIWMHGVRRYAAAAAILLLAGTGWYVWDRQNGIREAAEYAAHHLPDTSFTTPSETTTTPAEMRESVAPATDSLQGPVSPSVKETPVPNSTKKTKSTRRPRHPYRFGRTEMQYAQVEALPAHQLQGFRTQFDLPRVTLSALPATQDEEWSFSAEELLAAAEALPATDTTAQNQELPGLKQRLFHTAKNRLTDWAETAGLPVRQIGGISEIEIQY